MKKHIGIVILIVFSAISLSGCASFGKKIKEFVGGKTSSQKRVRRTKSYSSQPNFYKGSKKEYKQRVTKKKFENDAQLDSRAGSLWTMEGQGAYLFSQNVIRLIGDPIGIKIDGEPKAQLEAKVDTIKNLLLKLKKRRLALRRAAASEARKKKEAKKGKDAAKKVAAKKPPGAAKQEEQEVDGKLTVKIVPTRIVERLVDGNYRVKGSQAFLIDGKEYKVIVTGVVRSGDFNDEGISSTKLLDPRFDVVSARRRERL